MDHDAWLDVLVQVALIVEAEDNEVSLGDCETTGWSSCDREIPFGDGDPSCQSDPDDPCAGRCYCDETSTPDRCRCACPTSVAECIDPGGVEGAAKLAACQSQCATVEARDLCTAVTCEPAGQCQENTCEATDGQCWEYDKADGTACDDGDEYTSNDVCVSGECEGVSVDVVLTSDETNLGCEFLTSDVTGECVPSVFYRTTCLSGFTYTRHEGCNSVSEKVVCCPSADECAWYDSGCNWAALEGLFVHATEEMRVKWDRLDSTVQFHLRNSELFQTLSDADLLALDIELLAELRSVAGMTTHQLGVLAERLPDLSPAHFEDFLSSVNVASLTGALIDLSSSSQEWTAEQVEKLAVRLQASDAWGAASTWTQEQITSLGSMLTWVEAEIIAQVADAQLAISDLTMLSSEQMINLATKFGNMSSATFTAVLTRMDIRSLHAAMLSQCTITCEGDATGSFFADPSAANWMDEFSAYAHARISRGIAAARNYSQTMCSGADIGEALQIGQAEAGVCEHEANDGIDSAEGEVLIDSIEGSFEDWDSVKKSSIFHRLLNSSLAAFEERENAMLEAICGNYALLSPANIAGIPASLIVDIGVEHAIDGVFGPLAGSVVRWSVAKAAAEMSPEQRAAWAEKLRVGTNSFVSWSCEQVASAKEIIAGLEAEELAELSPAAVRGINNETVQILSDEQVLAFSEEQQDANPAIKARHNAINPPQQEAVGNDDDSIPDKTASGVVRSLPRGGFYCIALMCWIAAIQ